MSRKNPNLTLTQVLNLTGNLFLGSGHHKMVYIDPRDPKKCVKIIYDGDKHDIWREMRYRKALGKKADDMPLLTKYYGTIETDQGFGYVHERVVDYDGEPSRTLFDEIENPRDADFLMRVLEEFHQEFLRERFFTAGMDPKNFLVQRVSENEAHIRIIDNIGTSAKIPVEYWFDFLALRRAKRAWAEFLKSQQKRHPAFFTPERVAKLR